MSTFAVFPRRASPATRHLLAAGFGAIVAIAANCTFATESTSAHRYELSGTGTLSRDAPVQQSNNLRLKAMLSPTAIPADAPTLQSDGRFALNATLAAASLVCYADTIFRDDFDADGF